MKKVLFSLLGSLLFAISLFATTPEVVSTSINSAVTQLTIKGTDFSPTNSAPAVVLGVDTLVLVSFSNTQIVATLPTNEPSGSYELSVTTAGGAAHTSTFGVTIGVVGPTGPIGAQGPQGFTGATGATGPVGATGSQGPIGNAGATGAVGPQGQIGNTGPQGSTGPTGPTGDIGPQGPIGNQNPGLFGFIVNNQIFGYTTNISLTSTNTLLPAIGGGVSTGTIYEGVIKGYDYGSGSFNHLRVMLSSPLPSSAGDLHIGFRNQTTGIVMTTGFAESYFVVLNGDVTNRGINNPTFASGITEFQSPIGFNQEGSDAYGAPPNDQLLITISITGTATVVPSITWHIF